MESREPSAGLLRPLVVAALGVVAAFMALALVWYLGATISGTFWRAVIAIAMGLGIATFGIGYFRAAGSSQPAEEPQDVPPEYRLAYICEMCGLELWVVRVAKDKPPRHCGEEMVLVRR